MHNIQYDTHLPTSQVYKANLIPSLIFLTEFFSLRVISNFAYARKRGNNRENIPAIKNLLPDKNAMEDYNVRFCV